MAYRGKIGFHFPGRGNPNVDASDIKFLPAGITNPTSSDLVQVNKVYAIPAGVTITSVAQLQNYVVWELVNKKLINDTTTDQYLMVKFKPSQNINVSSIGILTDSNGNGSNNLTIVNDAGLLIYSGSKGSLETTTNTTIYEYTGTKRTRTDSSNANLTLYAGKIYWILYRFENCDDHRGAYLENSNGVYKNFGTWNDLDNFNSTNNHHPELSNLTFGNIVEYTSTYNSVSTLNYILTNCNTNDLVRMNWDNNYIWQYTLNMNNHSYKGVVKASCEDGDTSDNYRSQWGITDSNWSNMNLEVGDYFIIEARYYDGRFRLCQCTSTSPSTPTTSNTTYYSECYTIISTIDSEGGTTQALNSNVLSRIAPISCFIQYFNNGSGASYWNTQQSGKTYYLEINGVEHTDNSERV